MKSLAYFIFTVLTLSFIQAQKGQVTINQDERITELLEVYKTAIKNSGYYRIQVGFGTYARAQRIKSQVDVDFPGLYSKIDFDSPTYRVRLGRFKTKIAAERKFNEVRKKYPQAMLLKPQN